MSVEPWYHLHSLTVRMKKVAQNTNAKSIREKRIDCKKKWQLKTQSIATNLSNLCNSTEPCRAHAVSVVTGH